MKRVLRIGRWLALLILALVVVAVAGGCPDGGSDAAGGMRARAPREAVR